MPLAIHVEQYLVSHRKILDAISVKDPLRAETLMKNYIKEIARNLIRNPVQFKPTLLKKYRDSWVVTRARAFAGLDKGARFASGL